MTRSILLALGALIVFSFCGIVNAAKPVLAVWTATPNPQGVSSCPPCNRFWSDLKSDREFYASLSAAYEIKAFYVDRHPVQARLKMIEQLPTFLAADRRVVGYTSAADLLARLGLRPIRPSEPKTKPKPETQPPPGSPARADGLTRSQLEQILQPFADRLNGLNSSISKNAKNLQLFGGWFREDKKQHDLHQAAIAALNDQLAEIERRTQTPPQKNTPATPSEPAPTPESPGLFERALELGRYPATWFLGPAGGAGLTALLWFYRSRKQAAKPDLPEPIEGNAATIERLLDRVNRVEEAVSKRPAAVPVDSPPIREQSIEQQFVPYETDEFRRAVAFAHEQLVRKYPGAVGTVAFLDSLTDQYLQEVDAKDKSHVSQ